MDPIQPVPPEQTPTYQLPPVPKAPSHRTGIIVGAVIVVLFLAAAAAYFFTPIGAQLQAWLMPTSIPQELQGASFLSDSATGNTIIYQFPAAGKKSTDAGAVIVSAMQSPNGSARITRSADGTFRVLIGSTTVLEDKTARVGIDLSPDGKRIVFAQASTTVADARASSTSSFISPAALPLAGLSNQGWNVIMYDPATHTTSMLGHGAAPFFIDASHVAWIAPVGLAVADLSTGKSTVLVKDLSMVALNSMLVSPDHRVFAWYDAASKKLTEYTVTASTATALPVTTIAAYPEGTNPIHSLSLGNDSVYLLRRSGTKTDILTQLFGQQAIHAGNTPSSLGISRLMIGSL